MDPFVLRTGLAVGVTESGDPGWLSTRYAGVSWRPLHLLDEEAGGDATVLIRMAPGSSYPEHEHSGIEEVLILSGGYRDGGGEHRAGSYLRYPAGSRHTPVALGDPSAEIGPANPACVLFAVAHGGVRLTSSERG